MKILMMTNSYFPVVGGIERSLCSFSHEFRQMGHEVMIAAPACEGKANDEEFVIRLPAIKKFYHTEFSVNVPVPGLIPRLFKKFPPDIIHSHHPFFLGDVALRMSRQYHIPLVFTYHIMFEKYVHYLPVHNKKAQRFMVELAAGYCNLAHRVIAPSLSVRDILLNRGVTSPIDVIASGVDIQKFIGEDKAYFRRDYGIPTGAFVIGYVGRLAPEKNLECLVRCLIGFLKINSNAHVMIVGHGSSEEMIAKSFQHAGFSQNLHLLGVLHDRHLAGAFSAMDVFAFTSLSETQGMVLVEAMASGVPVVAMDSTGVCDVVDNFYNGRLVQAGNETMFIDALREFFQLSDEEKSRMSLRAKVTSQGFSTKKCASCMIDVYQRLLRQDLRHDGVSDNAWVKLRERMKAEWDIFKNLLEASEAAMHEEVSMG